MQQKNFVLAVILSGLILVGWLALSQYLWPPPKDDKAQVAQRDEKNKPKGEENKKPADKDKANDKKPADKDKANDKKPAEIKADEKQSERVARADLQQLPPTPQNKTVRLGAIERDSRFHLSAEIDPRGAGVRAVWLNKYQAADRNGRPEWRGEDKKPLPLGLILPGFNVRSPSFVMFAFDVNAPNDHQPLDTLGRKEWTFLGLGSDEVDGRQRQAAWFQAETQGVIVTKIYTLTEGEYHLGLEVRMRKKEGTDKNISFRYQMTGAHGLPVEGKWYTGVFRNALIARVDKNGAITRDLQDLRQISNWGGGSEKLRDEGYSIVYAAVANQYFAWAIVVDNEQQNRAFLLRARPTLESALTKGEIASISEDLASFALKPFGNELERTFYMEQGRKANFRIGEHYAILHHTAAALDRNGDYPEIATDMFPEDYPSLWVDDLTVRVATEPAELKDKEVVHKYLLYNGPVKVSQLFPPPGLAGESLENGGVQPELFGRYHDELHLNTLTDYQSPGAMGTFASTIYWTDLVIKCTNFMHAILGYLRATHLPYGLCIIVLTVLVRGLMFPLSRKQALMSVRMQQLQPEMKKLQEKYKDDRQALGMAQMELYRKHGVNPFGSCWVLLLQMPIFMGLYFALQESTHFRLAPLWPWITNLAAPDMMFSWTERIPFISRVQDYGSLLYLGPYFNLLPVIAVVLMIAQQKMITPPPADEQQAMQQKMMKYMMIVFGLMFYKMAAGLCLYFIATTVWGFCERKLLPKKQLAGGELPAPPAKEGYFQKFLGRSQSEQVTTAPGGRNVGITTSAEMRGRFGGKRRRDRRRQAAAESVPEDISMLGRWRKRLHDWWVAVLKEAEKKNRS